MEKINCSNRIKKLAELSSPCKVLADIGTDHALLPIYMLSEGLCEKAIAADINKGPLERARRDISEYGIESSLIELRLGSGLEILTPGECDTVVIAGMGGLTIAGILEASPEAAASSGKIILQPNSCRGSLRSFLAENGYEILDESAIEDEGQVYLFLEVKYGAKPRKISFTEAEMGSHLQNKPEDGKIFYAELKNKYEIKLAGLKKSTSCRKKEIDEIEELLRSIDKYETEKKEKS